MSKLFIIPGQLATFQSLKDRTLKLIFETGEPTPDQMAGVMYSLQKAGFIAFNPDPFKEKEKAMLTDLKVDFDDVGKSKGQRLRAVLFRCWEQDNQGHESFQYYYDQYLEKIITHYKNKLDG
ncbi:MAG TPA: hypothetical protein ENH85_02210 [Candidatus Scalindua sp.]|nr:hypothetical protein [Candidatus Scalindua sp.]